MCSPEKQESVKNNKNNKNDLFTTMVLWNTYCYI